MSRVGNIFELLSDENDEGGHRPVANTESGVKKQEQKPKAAAPTKPVQAKGDRVDNKGKDSRPPRSTEGKPERRQPREAGESQQGGQGQGERRVNRPPRQQREPREPREGQENREGSERRYKTLERTEGQEGAPRKRVFDRKSGTGRGPKDNNKRGGAGKANWGTIEDDQKAQAETGEKAEVKEGEAQEQPTGENKAPADAAAAQEVKEEEEVDNTKTLDEYKKSIKTPTFQLPPPRQIETKPEWASYTPVAREDDAKSAQKKKEEAKDEKKAEITADQVLNFTSKQQFSGRGGRGGRGGRDRDFSGKGKKQNTPAPNFKDEKSFPSLSNPKA